LQYLKESVSVPLHLGGDLNRVQMLYQFLLLLATSVVANFDDTCTVTSDVQCTDTQDEYTWKHSKGKAHVQLGFCQG
jgi:hypothetical protein